MNRKFMIAIIPLGITGEQTFSTICEVDTHDDLDPEYLVSFAKNTMNLGIDALKHGLTEEVVKQLLDGDPL